MQKERLMAIFIGTIMIMSIVGFGISNTRFVDQPDTFDIPNVVNRELTTEELVTILRSGHVIIENFYALNCTNCLEKNTLLETFANKFKNFIVLQSVEGNETSIKMIGAGGRIRDITEMELAESELTSVFCEIAIAQPRECLLEEI